MKKILILFLMSLSLVACGSSGDDSNDDGSAGGGDDGGVTKPVNVTAEPATMVAGTPTQITFVFDPPESVDTCTGYTMHGASSDSSCSIQGGISYSGMLLTNANPSTCKITLKCGGADYPLEITVTEP